MRPHPIHSAPSGFSLVEMLVVIAIIAILATILTPAILSVRSGADLAQCASNLRQIGVALLESVNVNQGQLPGPLRGQADPDFTIDASGTPYPLTRFSANIAEFLDSATNTSEGSGTVQQLICPARAKSLPFGTGIYKTSYLLQPMVLTTDGTRKRPFGYPASSSASPLGPLNINNIPNPSSAVVMFDLDQILWRQLGSTAPDAAPSHPVHGSVRNHLYFDGHVEAVRITNN